MKTFIYLFILNKDLCLTQKLLQYKDVTVLVQQDLPDIPDRLDFRFQLMLCQRYGKTN